LSRVEFASHVHAFTYMFEPYQAELWPATVFH
jgi:hypothetical protein